MTTAMLFGTFDIIHPGHINLFKQAKKHADDLIIIVARDKTVKRIKGFFPSLPEIDRKRNLEHFDTSFKVILGDLDDPYLAIREFKPEVICLGYDQKEFTDRLEHVLKEEGIKAKVIRLEPYKDKIYKSYLLKQKLKKKEFDISKRLESEMNKLKDEAKKDRKKQEIEAIVENQDGNEEKEATDPADPIRISAVRSKNIIDKEKTRRS